MRRSTRGWRRPARSRTSSTSARVRPTRCRRRPVADRLTDEQLAELARVADLAVSEPDPEGDCLACHASMVRKPGDEPTPLCHSCAHEHAATLGAVLAVLVAELLELRAQRRRPP